MEENYLQKVEGARTQMAEAQENIFTAYIDCIREKYTRMNEIQKQKLLKGLDLLITNITAIRIQPDFNYKKARQIRKEMMLTQGGLVKILGYSKVHSGTTRISKYEKGQASPKNDELSIAYLAWLKTNGY